MEILKLIAKVFVAVIILFIVIGGLISIGYHHGYGDGFTNGVIMAVECKENSKCTIHGLDTRKIIFEYEE